MSAELRELLKPPFKFGMTDRFIINKSLTEVIVDFGGAVVDDVKRFVLSAMNEKADRDFGEPLRWNDYPDMITCPKCKYGVFKQKNNGIHHANFSIYKHCPVCGQRLLPPEN
jgi:rubredoxin